jgi:hypothetical protein
MLHGEEERNQGVLSSPVGRRRDSPSTISFAASATGDVPDGCGVVFAVSFPFCAALSGTPMEEGPSREGSSREERREVIAVTGRFV